MAIEKPGGRLMHSVHFRWARPHGRRREINAGLALTSMIDFLIVVVVFLLMTFSASAEPCIIVPVNVPSAKNTLDAIDAPVVVVSDNGRIFVDGSAVGDVRAIDGEKRLQRIDALFDSLKSKREVWKQLHPGREFPGTVVLVSDDISRQDSWTPGESLDRPRRIGNPNGSRPMNGTSAEST